MQQHICVHSIKGAASNKICGPQRTTVVATTTDRSLSGRAIAACHISRTPLLQCSGTALQTFGIPGRSVNERVSTLVRAFRLLSVIGCLILVVLPVPVGQFPSK